MYQHGTPQDGANFGEQPGPPSTWFDLARDHLKEALDTAWVVDPERQCHAIEEANKAVDFIGRSITSLTAAGALNPGAAFVMVEQAEANLSAYVPAIPGCVATAPDLPSLLRELAGAIELHLEPEGPA